MLPLLPPEMGLRVAVPRLVTPKEKVTVPVGGRPPATAVTPPVRVTACP
jgi:hypothetical protein